MYFTFARAETGEPEERGRMIGLTKEYFAWMDPEISRLCGMSISDIVGMDINAYVDYTAAIVSRIQPEEGGLYFLRSEEGEIAAMGGLRRLPDGAAEIVRIYTRPPFRGHGCGSRMVNHLVAQASTLGYSVIKLDTGIFMSSAHRIHEAAGFVRCEPYAGAEPPEQLQPYWLYMQRPVGPVMPAAETQ